jgi:hypothetical protein
MNHSIENFIGVFDGLFDPHYCQSVISYFDHMDEMGYTVTRDKSEKIRKSHKSDTQLFYENVSYLNYPNADIHKTFNEYFWNQIYPVYINEYSILADFEPHSIYSNKIQKTKVGEGYHLWHSEQGSKSVSSRILAYTLYLNDVDEGGETEFLYYPRRIKPVTGRFLLFPAGFSHSHRGNPPLSNTKYIMTGWVQF